MLKEYLRQEHIFVEDSFEDTQEFYIWFTEKLAEKKEIVNFYELRWLFLKREKLQSTNIGNHAAMPHIFSSEFSSLKIYVTLVKEGLNFISSKEEPVYAIFTIMSNKRDDHEHLKLLSEISLLIKETNLMNNVISNKEKLNSKSLLELLLSKIKEVHHV